MSSNSSNETRVTEDEVLQEINQAVAIGDIAALEKAWSELELELVLDASFSEKSFALIQNLLTRSDFLRLEGAHFVLMIFEYNWDTLSSEQKDVLLASLEAAWPAFSDWMPRFVISGLLGEQFSNKPAFEVLQRLRTLEAEEHRTLVPHGLEHIVDSTNDANLSRAAYEELLSMKSDLSEQVQYEVEISLQRLANRGYKYN